MPPDSDTTGTLRAVTFESMGTVVSVRVGTSDHTCADAVPSAAAAVFERWDERFSLYRHDSELSRLARGDIRLTEASTALREVYALAIDWRQRTNGAFTPHRADGVVDLSGIVKALAIAEAGGVLTELGAMNWSVNAGGDILSHGRPNPGADWVAAVVDPDDRNGVLANLSLGALRAIATSGSAERGEHIWTALPVARSPFRQVTVLAADIVTADVLATTIVAGGRAALDDCTARWPVEVLAVLRDGPMLATPGLRR